MNTNVSQLPSTKHQASPKSSQDILQSKRSNELFFAVVGPVGAGGSRAIESLKRACEAAGYECEWIKASSLIVRWAIQQGLSVPTTGQKTLSTVRV